MKVFSAPDEVALPTRDFTKDFDLKQEEEAEQDYIVRLTAYVRSKGYTGPCTGEEFHIPWADGHARYLVLDTARNFYLMHLPLGDAWDVPQYMTRGVRKADVLKVIKARKDFPRASRIPRSCIPAVR